MGRSFNYYTKKIHRYLGIFIGIQFMMWTLGGLYFSWTDIREIRGEHLRKDSGSVIETEGLASPSQAVEELKKTASVKKIERVSLTSVLGKTYYEMVYSTVDGGSSTVLADAKTGTVREAFSEDEARDIAAAEVDSPGEIVSVEEINADNVGGHHEYRGKPLPAYALTYSEPENLVVYVSKNQGRIESFRTSSWRVFDFFWLFHTLDFYGRDDINNSVLRAFSVLGLVTIVSGYVLFVITSPVFRRSRKIKDDS